MNRPSARLLRGERLNVEADHAHGPIIFRLLSGSWLRARLLVQVMLGLLEKLGAFYVVHEAHDSLIQVPSALFAILLSRTVRPPTDQETPSPTSPGLHAMASRAKLANSHADLIIKCITQLGASPQL